MSNVHTHSKRKEDKVISFWKEGYICGYSEIQKYYRIYFPRFKKIDISRDVTFDEDSSYNKSRKRPVEDSEEIEVPRIQDTTMNDENQDQDREIEEPEEHVDPP